MSTLYVKGGCPPSERAKSILYNAPTTVRRGIRVKDTTFSNSPPHVTKVPTLILQDGTMLVGPQVFQYLERARQDPSFPQTPEHSEKSEFFHQLQDPMTLTVLLALALVAFVIFRKS